MREGLCHDIALKPFRGGRKIAIIDDADYLNQEGANCLLKTLEEPPADSLIILIGTSQQRQLPTIRSRCQIIRFGPLTDMQVATLLADTDLIEDRSRIAALAARAEGSLRRAVELSDPELDAAAPPAATPQCIRTSTPCHWPSTSTSWWKRPAKTPRPDVPGCGRSCWRPPSSIDVSCGNWSGAATRGDEVSDQFIAHAVQHWSGKAATASRCLDRCLAALNEIDANANLATLIAGWIDELRNSHSNKTNGRSDAARMRKVDRSSLRTSQWRMIQRLPSGTTMKDQSPPQAAIRSRSA